MTRSEGCLISLAKWTTIFFFPSYYHVPARVRARILSDNRHLTMDSIPQELIDTIIDNVPESDLLSCSLVAKRWRRKSQRRAFDTISFSFEEDMNGWCADISHGISSYVRHVKIEEISSWAEPALLSRMLGSLSSLTALSMDVTKIPDELPGRISRGEFGNGIITLYLGHSPYTPATMTMILSLPNLKELCIENCEVMPEEPIPIHPVTPQKRSLDSLGLHGYVDGVGEALAESQLTFSHLSSDVGITGIAQLLLVSSETLCGAWFLRVPRPSRDDSD